MSTCSGHACAVNRHPAAAKVGSEKRAQDVVQTTRAYPRRWLFVQKPSLTIDFRRSFDEVRNVRRPKLIAQ
ncbi:hypothetical protein ROA7745_01284 [Roseovarius aestuarii]|uniref:Uncharacterized protein n=1 Tax=Roseovarius aestuarii TaxID=475083 RepID=A0A1X7BPF9_9RHOB|nr:hypothetical protein ROA7745_01284 [Roseovarius aestuarii]